MPQGFLASGISAGLKTSGKSDLALLFVPEGANCAGTFTKSLIRASCIDLCKDRLKKTAGQVRAVLINSGQANACTGEVGLQDNFHATKALADLLNLNEEEVLICSTGLIGERIPMRNLLKGLNLLVDSLSFEGGNDAAKAILTTDDVVKEVAFEAEIDGRMVRIGGMAKGSGMIHPDMATMLAYLSCDASVPQILWNQLIKRVVNSSFNAITVDGDTSTNDTFLAFCAGQSLSKVYINELELGLKKVVQYLAKAIVRDGEGANCLLEVTVEGANNDSDARRISRCIASSLLVKTAVHGCDPNWGRILAAAGRAGVLISAEDVSLWIGHYQLVEQGKPLSFNRVEVAEYMKKRYLDRSLEEDSLDCRLVVGTGQGYGVAWGCDLSDQYIRINADYTT